MARVFVLSPFHVFLHQHQLARLNSKMEWIANPMVMASVLAHLAVWVNFLIRRLILDYLVLEKLALAVEKLALAVEVALALEKRVELVLLPDQAGVPVQELVQELAQEVLSVALVEYPLGESLPSKRE